MLRYLELSNHIKYARILNYQMLNNSEVKTRVLILSVMLLTTAGSKFEVI